MAGKSDAEAMNNFVTDLNVDEFPHIVDEDGAVWSEFGIGSQPAFVFINDDGTITNHNGALGAEALAERLTELRQQ